MLASCERQMECTLPTDLVMEARITRTNQYMDQNGHVQQKKQL